jgi:hypothetical protein
MKKHEILELESLQDFIDISSSIEVNFTTNKISINATQVVTKLTPVDLFKELANKAGLIVKVL